MRLAYKIVPIQKWPQPPTHNRQRSRFRATNGNTEAVLRDELAAVRARNVVVQMAVTHEDIRLDGHLRANARPTHPGVIVTYETDDGPISIPCDTYNDAWDNLRAIALTMEKLRAINRYGVAKNGEQYQGWRGLPAAGSSSAKMSLLEAATVIVMAAHPEIQDDDHRNTLIGLCQVDVQRATEMYRAAAKRLHLSMGGSDRDWTELSEAREVIMKHYGVI